MQLTLDSAVLEKLFAHAASAAHLVGHLDDAVAAGPLAEPIDAIAHELIELLGAPRLIVESEASDASSDAIAHQQSQLLDRRALATAAPLDCSRLAAGR